MNLPRTAAVAGAAVAACIIAVLLVQGDSPSEDAGITQVSLFTFDYTKNADIRTDVEEAGFTMSSPLKFAQKKDIKEHCTFFEEPDLQNQILYCTSTEIRNAQNHFLGNIHMVGTPENPRLIIAIIEASYEEAGDVAAIFDAVINNTVCTCWHEYSPGGFESVAHWVNALADFHMQGQQKTAASNVLVLEGFKIKSEITSIEGAHVWKLFVEG